VSGKLRWDELFRFGTFERKSVTAIDRSEGRDQRQWTFINFFQANDGKANGKATHALKVYFNGSPTKNSTEDDLTLVTYDGSTAEKKKATIERHKYHADAGKWHEVSVTFEGNDATVVVGRKTYTVTSERFLEPFEKIGVGHFSGTLETKELKLDKVR
jgi:hypothetical protein